MADFDAQEALLVKRREERRVRRALDRNAPMLRTRADFQLHVAEDPDFLVCLWVGSDELCPHWVALQRALVGVTKPKPATVHAKHYRIDALRCDADVLQQLRVSELPSALFYLKGAQTGEARGCSNVEKLQAVFRNTLINRNAEMFEYDEAKKPKPPQDEEAEEGEEGEEGAGADDADY